MLCNKTSLLVFFALLSSFAFAKWDPNKTHELEQKCDAAVVNFKNNDSDLSLFFEKAYGYVVFPSIKKGAVGIGGAMGKGIVYQTGKSIGISKLKQLSVGFQWGGQAYSEIIFFQNKKAFDAFISGKFELGATASVVALTTGVAANAQYKNGVAVFTITLGGLMYEAAVNGQKFKFEPFN